MPTRPPTFRPNGVRTKTERDREHDQRRGSAASRGYTWRWAKAAKTFLAREPLCRYCALQGNPVTAATCVDHLYPQQQFPALFWRTDLWVPSCQTCHNGFKHAIERQGLAALDALARRLGLPPLTDAGG